MTAKLFCVLGAIFLLPLLRSAGGEVRISLLQDTNAFGDTLNLLTSSGCTTQGTAVFERAVHRYFEEPFNLDLSRFPKSTNGFYSFSSPQELVRAWPGQAAVETNHSFAFNCTDVVIALAEGQLQTTFRPDDNIGTIMVTAPRTRTNQQETVLFAATARGAFDLGWPAGWQEIANPLFPASMREARICLTPLLLRWHSLPRSAGAEGLESKVLEVLRTTWREEALQFPSRFEVVMVHTAGLSDHRICTRHTALLFQTSKGYTYIEKAGGSGPFVRLDLAERSDLMPWLAAPMAYCANTNCHHFATFSERTITRIGR